MKIKWYMWATLIWLPTRTAKDISVSRGVELTTIMHYRQFRDVVYVIDTKYSTRPASGKANRRTRRNK